MVLYAYLYFVLFLCFQHVFEIWKTYFFVKFKKMKQRRTNDDEESLLRSETAKGDVEDSVERKKKMTAKIPRKAIKSIIIAILLILLGTACLIFLALSFTESLYYVFGQNRLMLVIIGILAISCGSYTLYIARNCYYMVNGYRWPMLFM